MDNEFMIRSLWIQGYRGFKDFKMDFHPQMTVIVGDNGVGKTSLIEALRLAMWARIKDLGRDTAFWLPAKSLKGDLYYEQQEGVTEKAKEFKIIASSYEFLQDECFGGDGWPLADVFGCHQKSELKWMSDTRVGDLLIKLVDVKFDYLDKLSGNAFGVQSQSLPVFAYFGIGRLSRRVVKAKFSNKDSPKETGYMGLFALQSLYMSHQEFFTLLDAKLPHVTDDEFYSIYNKIHGGVVEAIKITTGWTASLGANKSLLYQKQNGPYFTLKKLGHGVQNMIQLVSELAIRCALLNPQLGEKAAKETAGVVFIDEVDLHLHPSWQQTILLQLQEAFPNIQFIVTTHSPQVLTSVDKSCIRVLHHTIDSDTGAPLSMVRPVTTQTKGISSADLLALIMEVEPVPNVPEARALSEYHALIQQNLHESSEGQGLRKILDEHFGVRHPLMRDCECMIRLQAFKQRLPRREN